MGPIYTFFFVCTITEILKALCALVPQCDVFGERDSTPVLQVLIGDDLGGISKCSCRRLTYVVPEKACFLTYIVLLLPEKGWGCLYRSVMTFPFYFALYKNGNVPFLMSTFPQDKEDCAQLYYFGSVLAKHNEIDLNDTVFL